MGFHESVRTVLWKKYATFSGRASRSEYWWFQLLYWALLAAYVPLLVTVSEATGGAESLIPRRDKLDVGPMPYLQAKFAASLTSPLPL